MEYDLERFVRAQQHDYPVALQEIQEGRKRSHWIWYVFPQLTQLGRSYMAQHYGISGMEEARAYLMHPVLGPRLREISEAVLFQPVQNPRQLMGYPDDMKLRSSMTLFEAAEGERESVFSRVLDALYNGERDGATLELLQHLES